MIQPMAASSTPMNPAMIMRISHRFTLLPPFVGGVMCTTTARPRSRDRSSCPGFPVLPGYQPDQVLDRGDADQQQADDQLADRRRVLLDQGVEDDGDAKQERDDAPEPSHRASQVPAPTASGSISHFRISARTTSGHNCGVSC